VPVHHRLRLLAFPMRTAVLGTHSTTAARQEISSEARRVGRVCRTLWPPEVENTIHGEREHDALHGRKNLGRMHARLGAGQFRTRHVLCWPAFPLDHALRSTGSAALARVHAYAVGCSPLCAVFSVPMSRRHFSCPCIIGYGSSPSRCGPPYLAHTRQRRPDRRYPRFRYDPFARDVALDPGRASAPRMAMPHMLPSSE